MAKYVKGTPCLFRCMPHADWERGKVDSDPFTHNGDECVMIRDAEGQSEGYYVASPDFVIPLEEADSGVFRITCTQLAPNPEFHLDGEGTLDVGDVAELLAVFAEALKGHAGKTIYEIAND